MILLLNRVTILLGIAGVYAFLVIGNLGCGDSGPPERREPPMGPMPMNENPQAEKESTKTRGKKGKGATIEF